MSLLILQEMLELNEIGKGLVSAFKSGYQDSKHRHDRVSRVLSADDRQTRSNTNAQARANRTQQAAQTSTTPAVPRQSPQQTQRVNLQNVADDLTEYIRDFFTKFPNVNDSLTSSEYILQNHTTKEARAAAANAYKSLATRVKELRKGFNTSIVRSGKVSLEQMKTFNDAAKNMASSNAPTPPQALIKFVRKESSFFIRLVKIKGNAQLNDNDFKQLLQLKINQTSPERVPDAAQALNLLFGYMESQFKKHADVISTAINDSEEQDRNNRIAARRTSQSAEEN